MQVKMHKPYRFVAWAAVVALGCTGSSALAGKSEIVDTAVSAGEFNTLVAAVKAGDLVETLKGDGPFTVFAPTDDAFAKLPPGTLESLLRPENKKQLVGILTYHVVSGRLASKDMSCNGGAVTVNGQRLAFNASCSNVTVGNAKVVAADIGCSNGVIHAIDTVLLPTSANIVETAQSAKGFSTLLTAATQAGLVDVLSNGGPFTVFAPTDEAFAQLPAGTIESLLKPENRAQLARILKYHVIAGRVYSDAAAEAGKATTLIDEDVKIEDQDGKLTINGANVVMRDLDASNGVIHVIDKVILPTG
jgi:transforming growth factor-beta-induced protein